MAARAFLNLLMLYDHIFIKEWQSNIFSTEVENALAKINSNKGIISYFQYSTIESENDTMFTALVVFQTPTINP